LPPSLCAHSAQIPWLMFCSPISVGAYMPSCFPHHEHTTGAVTNSTVTTSPFSGVGCSQARRVPAPDRWAPVYRSSSGGQSLSYPTPSCAVRPVRPAIVDYASQGAVSVEDVLRAALHCDARPRLFPLVTAYVDCTSKYFPVCHTPILSTRRKGTQEK
jgi:hypothetical protein